MTEMTPREQGDALRGTLRLTVGGEEIRLRKLKLHPAEDWLDSNAPRLGPLVRIDSRQLEKDLGKAVQVAKDLFGALIEAIAAYDQDNVVGDAEAWMDAVYPDEVLPIFLAMRDAVLPFAGMLTDHQAPAAAASSSPSSTNGRSPDGASIPTPSGSASTPDS